MSTLRETGWTPIATLLRPQGRRGELLAEPLTDLPEIFATGTSVSLAAAGSVPIDAERQLQQQWFPTGRNAGRVVLKLSGCDSIDQAEALSGLQVLIASTALPALDPDTFFVGDLLGCAFFNGDTAAGTIVDVQFATGPDGRTRLEDAAPLLGVELTPGADPVLIPFVRAWLEVVDLANRRIVMQLPEGLLEDGTDSPEPG